MQAHGRDNRALRLCIRELAKHEVQKFSWQLDRKAVACQTVGRDETVIREYIRQREDEDRRLEQLELTR